MDKRILYKAMVFAFIALTSSISFGSEVVEVCATYKNTGEKYKVKANVMSGEELNQKTNDFRYKYLSTYAIIFWGKDQASVIELSVAPDGITIVGVTGKDQQGHPWELTTSLFFCN